MSSADTAFRRKNLTTNDLAEFFGVTSSTILGWRKAGKLPPPLPVAGHPRWDAGEFWKWYQRQQEGQGDAPQ